MHNNIYINRGEVKAMAMMEHHTDIINNTTIILASQPASHIYGSLLLPKYTYII